VGGGGEAAGWHSVGRATDDGVVACEIIVRTLHLKVHAQRKRKFLSAKSIKCLKLKITS
jgi:hypothetical protein